MNTGDSLRSGEIIDTYRARRDRGEMKHLRDLPRKWSGVHWIVVENEFPYDKILSEHHLLVPKRDFKEEHEMNIEELTELLEMKRKFAELKLYDAIMLNFPQNRTVPGLFHYHLLTFSSLTNL